MTDEGCLYRGLVWSALPSAALWATMIWLERWMLG